KSAQIREILISESAWEEMTCLFAPSLVHLLNDLQAEGEIDAQRLSQIMTEKTQQINEAGNEIWLNLITREKNNPIFYNLGED
ncbi:hypothetical protein V5044_18920, partial [Enterobacter hormaechei]